MARVRGCTAGPPAREYGQHGPAAPWYSRADDLLGMKSPGPREIAEALRLHLAEHNRRATIFAGGMLAVSLVLWLVLYFVAHWLTMLFVTVVSEGTAPVPRGVGVVFGAVVASLLAYAWVDRRLRPDERPRDVKPMSEIVADVVLGLPRMTLGAWSTFTARQHLTDADLAQAGEFLARLASTGRVPLSSAGYEMPDSGTRERVLFALQITGVIDVIPGREGTSIYLNAQRPASLGLAASAAPSAHTASQNEG